MEKLYDMHKLVGLQIFLSGTPTFSSGTPTFCQMGVLNSCFQNPSESSEFHHFSKVLIGKKSVTTYSKTKTCVKRPLSERPQIGFQDQLSLNAGQKYCRMLPLEHSAILSTFIKLPFVIKTFILSIFELLFYTGFTV